MKPTLRTFRTQKGSFAVLTGDRQTMHVKMIEGENAERAIRRQLAEQVAMVDDLRSRNDALQADLNAALED